MDRRLRLREIDVLALPGAVAVVERREHRRDREPRRDVVAVGRHHRGGAVGPPGDTVEAGDRRAHRAEPGETGQRAALPEEAAAQHDQIGFDRLQRLVVEPPRRHRLRRERLADDVGPAHEVAKHRPPLLAAQVERHAELPGVHVLVQHRLFGARLAVLVRAEAARGVDARRRLDLHDGRAVVGEDPRRGRSGHDPHEVEHLEIAERSEPRAVAAVTARRRGNRRQLARDGQHLGVVLADRGCAAPVLDRRRAQLRERPGVPHGATETRILAVAPVVARRELLTAVEILDGGHRRDQQPALERAVQQLLLRLGAGEVGDRAQHALILLGRLLTAEQQRRVVEPVLVPRRLVAEALLVHPLHEPAGERADGAEEEGDRDVAVRRVPDQGDQQRTERYPAGLSRRLLVADGYGEDRRLRRLRRRLLRRDVHVLPAAGAQSLAVGDQGRARGLCAAVQEGLRDGVAQRRAVVVAGHRHRPGRRHHRQVGGGVAGLRPVLPEGADRDVDESGVELLQRLVAEAQRGHVPGVGRLDEEVGARHQPLQIVATLLALEVEHDGALVARVGGPVERALRPLLVTRERADAPRAVAVWRLDRDHVGAQIGEYLSADHPSLVGQVENSVRAQHRQDSPRSVALCAGWYDKRNRAGGRSLSRQRRIGDARQRRGARGSPI